MTTQPISFDHQPAAFDETSDVALPSGMHERGERLCRYGDDTSKLSDDGPIIGDLWIAAAGAGRQLGLVLVTAINDADGYVTVSPVTPADTTPGYERSVLLTGSLLGVPLVWNGQFGADVDPRVLVRRIGQGVEAFKLIRGMRYCDAETNHGVGPIHETGASEAEVEDFHAALTDRVRDLHAAYVRLTLV